MAKTSKKVKEDQPVIAEEVITETKIQQEETHDVESSEIIETAENLEKIVVLDDKPTEDRLEKVVDTVIEKTVDTNKAEEKVKKNNNFYSKAMKFLGF